MSYFLKRIAFTAIFAALVFGYNLYQGGKLPAFVYGGGSSTTVKVIRGVDGDTILVDYKGKQTYVRFIGIDTPEDVKPGVSGNECGSLAAAKNMASLVEGKRVTLKTDPTQGSTDRYGRLLAYVVLPNGETAQAAQLKAGLAYVYVYDNKRFQMQDRFESLQAKAKSQRRGTWGSPCDGNFHSLQ